jgi:D-3-phosphoglycerate dehydrogenase
VTSGPDGRKKVFIVPLPMAMHRAVADVLEAAGDIEVVYGLDEADRWATPADAAEEARLAEHAEQVFWERLPELHAVYAAGPKQVGAAAIERGDSLEVVFVRGTGLDMVDVAAATAHDVAVVNAVGVNSTPVSDYAVGVMVALSMRITLVDRFHHREQRWLSNSDLRRSGLWPTAISGKTVGVIGLGFIGREIARKCRDGFRMRVLAFDPFFDRMEAERQGVTLVDSLEEMIPQCDFVSVNVPLTPATRGIVGEAELRLMKPSAYLINTSRGGTVDADALLEALQGKWIAGAGLDVTDPEPLPDGHPLYDLENVVISPHISGGADDTLEQLGTASSTEAVRVLRGQRSFRVLNPQVLPALFERQREAVPA